jgi:zinc protease
MMSGRTASRWRVGRWTVAFGGTITLSLASCSVSSGVTSTQANQIDGSSTAPNSPSGLPSLSTPDPDTIADQLDNGLRYLIRENDNPGGKVELRLVIDAGSGLETDTQVGGAHFLEHMLFNGTEKFPKNELIDVLRSFGAGFGADINAYTSSDETVYTLTVPNDEDIVDTGLDVLEQWLSFATIDADAVEAERGVVLDEWRTGDQSADGRVFDAIAGFFLAGTPYDGHSPIGGRDAIENIAADELRSFYDDWYRPDNAAVIVVGDVDADRIEEELIARFGDASNRGSNPSRVELVVDPSTSPQARVFSDPDVAEGSAFVTLPLARESSGSAEVDQQNSILELLAFEVIATRLDNDALRGEAPFERASVDSSSIVRGLDAPEISVTINGAGTEASVQAVLDEYERFVRFGVTEAELANAIGSQRSSVQLAYDSRETRQDASFADEYVRHVLEGEWFVEAQQEFDFFTAVLDAATVDNVAAAFADRYDRAAVHIFVALPEAEVGDGPEAAELVVLVEQSADRTLEPRVEEAVLDEELMLRPEPVEESDSFDLVTDSFSDALDPQVLVFENGVRVVLNSTSIVDGTVFFEARSPGGLATVADDDVADAQALSSVLLDSGVATFDRVALDQLLGDKSIEVLPFVDQFTDAIVGSTAATDLEVMFQLINQLMAAPRVEQLAIDRYVDDQLPYASDPGIDASYAEFAALLDARYDDPRFLVPTAESLATVDVEGVQRVVAQRFGDAGDWTFSFSGDFDEAEATDLARSYLATLPSTGQREPVDFSEPAAPVGPTVVDVEAGQGETANVSFLFSGSASSDRRDRVVAQILTEIVNNRLTDFIREELGDSYSPFAIVEIGAGTSPSTEVYISVSTSPELIEEVSTAVLDQLNDLRANGPSSQEFDNAIAAVEEGLGFVNDEQINDEVLDVLVDSDGSGSFDDFVGEFLLVDEIEAADIGTALEAWTSSTDYIEVRVQPGA